MCANDFMFVSTSAIVSLLIEADLQEVGIRLFYQCILVQSSGDLSRLAKRFETQRELGELARSFFLLSNPFSFYDPEKFAFILSCCSNLRRMGYLDDSWLDCDYPKFQLDWQTVSALALQNSAKLVDLEVHIREGCGPSRDLAVLLNFNNLKTLDWHSDLNLHFDHTTISKSSLCYLERLACSARDITFLSLMSYLESVRPIFTFPRAANLKPSYQPSSSPFCSFSQTARMSRTALIPRESRPEAPVPRSSPRFESQSIRDVPQPQGPHRSS